MNRIVIAGIASLVLAVEANAGLVLVDDFNDGVAAGWTNQEGTVTESAGTLGTVSPAFSLATMDGQSGTSIGVDAISGGAEDTGYVALVLNFTSLSDNLFIKLQDNGLDGNFDRVFFYHGNNTAIPATSGAYFFDLTSGVASTFFQATDNGDGTASAFVGATGQTFNITLAYTYTGSGVGLGFFREKKRADNFYVEGTSIPEPTTLALLGFGLAALGFSRRRTH